MDGADMTNGQEPGVPIVEGADASLAQLVHLANLQGESIEVSVALLIGGAVVWGRLIGGWSHWSQLSRPYRAAAEKHQAGPTSLAHVLADMFQEEAELYPGIETSEDAADAQGYREMQIGNLHLANVKIQIGATRVQMDGLRVDLRKVDAWGLGSPSE